MPSWSVHPLDPISVCDVLHYLVAAADADRVPAGAYDISGPETTSYGDLLRTYARMSGKWRAELPVNGIDTGLVSLVTGLSCRSRVGWPGISFDRLTIRWWRRRTGCASWCRTHRAA